METVLVTGVTGRVGANLAVALQRGGDGVRGLVMPGDPQATKIERLEIDTVQCDLRNTDAVLRACQESTPSYTWQPRWTSTRA